jgi:hypothetical protein
MAAHYLQQGGQNYGRETDNISQRPDTTDFFNKFKGMSPEMINMGLTAGQASFDRVVWQVWPGMSSFWSSLKIYFTVSGR